MKKFIWISLVFFLFACGGRKSAVEIDREKKLETVEAKTTEKEAVKSEEIKSTVTENSATATTSVEKKETVTTEEAKESSSQKTATETSGKTLKRRSYYENGLLKSETDYTENFSKVESENANLKSKLSTQSETISELKAANTSLQQITDNQKQTISAERSKNTEYKKQIEELKKQKFKKTDRESYPWYWIVAGAILLWELLKMGLKKAFPQSKLFNFIKAKFQKIHK